MSINQVMDFSCQSFSNSTGRWPFPITPSTSKCENNQREHTDSKGRTFSCRLLLSMRAPPFARELCSGEICAEAKLDQLQQPVLQRSFLPVSWCARKVFTGSLAVTVLQTLVCHLFHSVIFGFSFFLSFFACLWFLFSGFVEGQRGYTLTTEATTKNKQTNVSTYQKQNKNLKQSWVPAFWKTYKTWRCLFVCLFALFQHTKHARVCSFVCLFSRLSIHVLTRPAPGEVSRAVWRWFSARGRNTTKCIRSDPCHSRRVQWLTLPLYIT